MIEEYLSFRDAFCYFVVTDNDQPPWFAKKVKEIQELTRKNPEVDLWTPRGVIMLDIPELWDFDEVTEEHGTLCAEFGAVKCYELLSTRHEFMSNICTCALVAGQLAMAEIAYFQHFYPIMVCAMEHTARNGHFDCLMFALREWHRSGGQPLNLMCERMCEMAAGNGHLECLIASHRGGATLTADVCNQAALNGYIECLMYAVSRGAMADATTCSHAALGGHLCCLAFLHDQNVPWDAATCELAAGNGNLECLKYAHQHGCPMSRAVVEFARIHGKLDCVRYAVEHGCPYMLPDLAVMECDLFLIEHNLHRPKNDDAKN